MSGTSGTLINTPLSGEPGLVTVRSCPTCGSRSFSTKRPKAIYDTPLSLLRGGVSIPAEERPTIASNIQRFRADVVTLNREVKELYTRIELLESQRADLQLAINYQTGLLSPIRALPEEILVEIFTFCTQGRVDVCSPRADIWQFEKVCKRWRTITHSTPTIWNSVDVYLGSLTPYRAGVPLSTVLRLVEQCIRLSRDSPLSIRFVEIGSADHFREVFGLLLPTSHRWKDMSFSMSMLCDAPVLEYGVPNLRTLGLSGAYRATQPFDSFQTAQQLVELRLFSFPQPFRTLIIPWYQLRYFQAVFCDFRTGEFMDMLAHMPSLVGFCSKWGKGLLKNHRKSVKPIKFRHLQSIELEAAPAEICTVLQPLTVPVLRELHLVSHQFSKSAGSPDSRIADCVVAMVQRSGATCALAALSLSSVDAASVSRILAEAPDVGHLSLAHITDVEAVLHEISTAESVVPRMHTFSLTCKGNQAMFSVGPLAAIVRSRGIRRRFIAPHGTYPTSPGRLRALNITVREGGDIQQMQELLDPLGQENGVSVTIHYLE